MNQVKFCTEQEYDEDVAEAFRTGVYTGMLIGATIGSILTVVAGVLYFFVY